MAHKNLVCFTAQITSATYSGDSRFAPNQWEKALLCNGVSHWLGTNLESALYLANIRHLKGDLVYSSILVLPPGGIDIWHVKILKAQMRNEMTRNKLFLKWMNWKKTT